MDKKSKLAHPLNFEQPELSIVIPCYNEADVIRNTTYRLVESFRRKNINLELVLVDNGSTDETEKIIDEMIAQGLPIVKSKVNVNQGYGKGVLYGLQACMGKFVGFTCADGQVEAEDVVRVYEIAHNSKTPKLVKVRRRFRMDGMIRKIISIIYNAITIVMFGRIGSIDVNGNPKILPYEYLKRMNLQSKDWFLDAEVMIKAKRLGLEVYEFNVMAQMRGGGKSHVRPQTCWEFIVNLLKCRFSGWGKVEIEIREPFETDTILNKDR
jgi:glycosyltransferase involved in cell wall biosynthesis